MACSTLESKESRFLLRATLDLEIKENRKRRYQEIALEHISVSHGFSASFETRCYKIQHKNQQEQELTRRDKNEDIRAINQP